MGQQRLLLVVLVTIIVCVAIVLAINVFDYTPEKSNINAVHQDVAMITTALQGYYMKPVIMGGGGNTFTSKWIKLNGIPCKDTDLDGLCSNKNGTYDLTMTDTVVTITAYPASAKGYTKDHKNNGRELAAKVTPDNMKWYDNNIDS